MRRSFLFGAQLTGLVLLASCGGDAPSGIRPLTADQTSSAKSTTNLAALVIAPHAPASVSVGATTKLTATLYNYLGGVWIKPIAWTSRDTTIASIDSTGVVSARKVGTVIIAASAAAQADSVAVTVLPVPVKTVTVTAPASMSVGATVQAAAQPYDSTGVALSGTVIAWSSRAPSVAVVSTAGVVTGLSAGSAIIDAVAGGITGSTTVTVVAAQPPTPKTIGVSVVSASLSAGATTQASAIVRDSLGNVLSGQAIVWTSTNMSIATVSASGLVTSLTAGSTTITANAGTATGGTAVAVTSFVPASGPYAETLAALPAVYLNTTAPAAPASGGVVINVAAGGNLQTAINAAKPGDVIALANGATFVGNFTLPNKNTTSTNWITIRPANLAGFPAEGARMTPTIAAAVKLPKLLSPTALGAIATAPGAHHYRIIGMEVSLASTSTSNTGLVRFGEDGGNGQITLASVPHDLVLDRSYVHGTPTASTRRGVALNSAYSAVIDSYISDCHDVVNGSDAQAIMGWNGPGPFKITNNYLEGSSENIMFGGGDPGIANLVPSDIEIRHNHFFKPASWKGKWLVKNLYESKNSQRVLIEGNLFENNWQDGQAGTAISLKSSSMGACPWCVTQDVTFRYNLVRNVGGAVVVSGSPDNAYPDIHARRLTIVDNVFQDINSSATFNGTGYGLLVNGDPADVTFAHNTVMTPNNAAVFFSAGISARMSIRDNVMGGGLYGVKGSGAAAGSTTMATFTSNGHYLANVMSIPSVTGYPTGNYFPTSPAAIGFVSLAGYDFHLASSSSYLRKATDGRDPGAGVDTISSLIANIIVP
ncbi:MAG: Ig-like domain-containing protein [bacterium]